MQASSSPLYCQHCGAENPVGSSACFACQSPLATCEEGGQHVRDELLQERYRILAQVGTGGFGAVYKAVDTLRGDGIVAIKQINLRGLTTQQIIEATDGFHREVRLLSNLKHPNLPAIRDSFTDPQHWYIVMDFIEGENLEAYLKQRSSSQPGLPLDEVFAIGLQLCTVLDYLHTREPAIIFRDLKPSNIMRAPDGRVYLIDFGIARHFVPGKPRDTIPFGSPGYAAPEQYGRSQTTPQADIYSLGALLHQMLTGDDPADTPFHFAPLRLYGPPYLAGVQELLQRMVQVDSSKRPASIAEVKEELQRLAGMQEKDTPRLWRPPEAPPPLPVDGPYAASLPKHTSAGHAQIQARRTSPGLSRRQFINAGAAIGAATVLGLGSVTLCRFLTTPHFSGVIADSNLTPALAPIPNFVFYGHKAAVTTMTWSRYGQYIASGSADKTVLVWRAADGMLLYKYVGYTSPLTSVAWSSDKDDEYIASCGQSDGSIQLWEALTGNDNKEFIEHSGRVLALVWARYNSYIASGGEDKLVRLWEVDTGKIIQTYRGHTASIRALAWSRDDLIASASADKTVRIWANHEATHIPVYRGHAAGVNAVAWNYDGSQIASASDDGTVQVWNVVDGGPVVTYHGHKGKVNAVIWFDNYNGLNPLFVSGGEDKTVQLWNISGKRVAMYTKHTAPVTAVAAFGSRIASSSADGTVHIWTPPAYK